MNPLLPTHTDVQHFQELGYWIAPVLFSNDEINELRDAFQKLYAGHLDHRTWPFVPPVLSDAPDGIRTALFSAYVNRTIEAAVSKPILAAIAGRLLEVERVRYWQDQSIWKPPGSTDPDAGNIGFHQDYDYWQDSSTTNMVSANIALQDVPIERGCLQVFPRSHKLGLLDAGGDFFNTDLVGLQRAFQTQTGEREIPLPLKAGQVSFHHSLLVHGSGPNQTDQDRLVLAPAYMPDGTFYREEGQPPCPHSDFLGSERQHGMVYEGEHFPLIETVSE